MEITNNDTIEYFYYTSNINDVKEEANLLYAKWVDVKGCSTKVREKKLIALCRNFMYNAMRCKLYNTNTLVYTVRNEFFSQGYIINGKSCRIPYSRRLFREFIAFLEEEKIIEVSKGGQNIWQPFMDDCGTLRYIHKGREVSKMRIHRSILDLFGGKEPEELPENLLVLRDGEKNDKPFNKYDPHKRMIDTLVTYNEYMRHHTYENSSGGLLQTPQLRRIFNENFKQGGRFYTFGAVIQGMPSDDRGQLLIDGEEVVEVDIKAIHPAIMYTENDLVMDFDPYGFEIPCDVDQEEIEKHRDLIGDICYNPSRNLAKLVMLVGINAETQRKAELAVATKLGEDKRKKPEDRKFVGLSKVKMIHTFESMRMRNMPLYDKFCSGEGRRLQYRDSTFMENVLINCIAEDVCAIPIHDSILVKESDQALAISAMESAWDVTFGNTVNFDVEVK